MDNRNKNKQKILITDDSVSNRDILAGFLGNDYEIIEAADGEEAVSILQQQCDEIDLVLLDFVMPKMNGFDVLELMNKRRWIDNIPVIMISTENSPTNVSHAYEMGVTDYIQRPFDILVVQRRVSNTLMLYGKQKRLMGMVMDQIYENQKSNSLMINILSHIVEFRNGESGLHVLHISTMTEILLKRLIQKTDKYKLTSSDISMISIASALHDIGKIAIPEEVLNKPGRLTPEEYDIIKTHSAIGADMLKSVPYQDEQLVKTAYEICRWHHERYDGKGYPDGLKGDEIPISAQIVSIADVYDALTSERVYKKAFTHEVAMQMILNGECGSFSPFLLECLEDCAEEIQTELNSAAGDSRDRQKEAQDIAEEILTQGEITSAEQMKDALEYEKVKYQFFCSVSRDVLFEYTRLPSILTIPAGAESIGLPPTIVNPAENQELSEIFDYQTIKQIIKLLYDSTPEEPVVEMDCKLMVDGRMQDYHLICHVNWSQEERPKFKGVIGKAVKM